MNITEVLVQPQAMAWLPWAVQYFFYIGSAYAAAILFLIALLFEQHTSHRLRAALVLTMAIGAIVGPLALTGDLHQPGRAWHFYAHITPWSWMSLGSLFLPVFSALAVATAWLYLRQDLIALRNQPGKVLPLLSKLSLGEWTVSHKVMLTISAITVLSGLTIALYTGAEIAIVKSRSLWHQPASPILWFVTAFMGAVGFSLLIWLLLPSQSKALTSGDNNLLKKSLVTSGVLTLILLPIWASNNSTFSLYSSEQWMHNIALLTFVVFRLYFARLHLLARYPKVHISQISSRHRARLCVCCRIGKRVADSLVHHHGSTNHRQVRCRAVSIPTHYGWKWLDRHYRHARIMACSGTARLRAGSAKTRYRSKRIITHLN